MLIKRLLRLIQKLKEIFLLKKRTKDDDVIDWDVTEVLKWTDKNRKVNFKGVISKNPLVIDTLNYNCRFLKLSLQEKSSFHLDFIEVFDENDENVALNKKVLISSVYQNNELYSGQRFVAGSNSGGCGFHTENESNPWVMIDLQSIHKIKKLVIYNRDDAYYKRALSLKVEATDDLYNWVLLFDNWSALNSISDKFLSSKLYAFLNAYLLNSTPAIEYLDQLKSAGNITAALEFQNEINLILEKQNFALGPHGFTQTFSLKTVEQKNKVLQELSWLLDIFNHSLNKKAFVSSGTLLGVVRDNQLIPHDDDVDICYISDYSDEALILEERQEIVTELRKRGCKVSRSSLAHYWCITPGGQSVDLFTGYCRDERCYMNPIGSTSVNNVLPLKEMFFHGYIITLPKEPIPILEINYGDDWKNPDPLWSFDWSNARKKFDFLYFR